MISFTKLLTGDSYFGDKYRYTATSHEQKHGVSEGMGPVVGWNYTRKCNLKCVHCYSQSANREYENELTTEEAKRVIDDLAEFKVPTILFSGGEPLIRHDFFELAEYASKKGIRPTISTNGTLITKDKAKRIKEIGVGYVGISLDGLKETNDKFRGVDGAFDAAIKGIRNCREIDQRVGFRFTINKHNFRDVSAVMDLLETENVNRICFYHLVYTGRGADIMKDDLTHEETRETLDLIIERTLDFHRRGLKKEVLMVDNHADGPYLYLKYKDKDPERAEFIKNMLQSNGGNRSGIAFANIDNLGNVHPDQFTQNHTVGNVREKKFGDIWTSTDNPIMAGLKDRKKLLPEKCQKCGWLSCCNGNFRARAEAVSRDFWGFDPQCFLTDEERAESF